MKAIPTWKQRKLGELMGVASVKRIHQSDWTNSGIRFLRARDIVAIAKGEEPDDSLYISKERYNEYTKLSGKVKKGDLLVTGVGSIGVPLLITSDRPLYFKDGNIIWFKNENRIDGNFLYFSFINNKIQKYIQNVAGIGTVGTYTISSGKITPITLPTKAEQNKIGICLKKIDDTIALHQEKLSKLQSLKEAALQSLFPQKNETEPKVRFANFSSSWKQRKLGELVERVTRKNKNLDSTLPLTVSAQDGLVDQNEYFTKTVASRNVSNYYLLKKGEFAYNKSYSNGYPLGAIKRLDKYEKGVLSTLYVVFKPTYVNSDFLAKYYDSTHWYYEVYKHAAEGVRNHGLLNISPSDFFSTELKVPKSYEEQSKIGIFINKLDNSIALHQQRLEKLQNCKKAFLQKMFI
ncbi:restriction endonuclease subunit S [Tetragenococcus halophilus]|uniref:restriction endonuclease subunit S n=1 Tax=Tetragenococcus halophilus TaxID=51669 RepID=UPI002155B1C5|nr:restriction endonuclease subunit S [Tetragenococcus halophilus]